MKETKISIVYKNVFIYRIIMNILYGFKYKKRFHNVVNLFLPDDKSILELCFGDIFIAEYCDVHHLSWMGLDINSGFVSYAKEKGYNAILGDIQEFEFPQVDTIIMIGSLYHFINDIEHILEKMLKSGKKIIISEPIKNLSNHQVIGIFAKKAANAGKGDEEFRFNEQTFIDTLNQYTDKLNFTYQVISKDRDILVELHHA